MRKLLVLALLLAAPPALATIDPLQLPVRAAPAVSQPAPVAAAPARSAEMPAASERPPIPPPLLESTARQIEAQARGDYGPMERWTQLPPSVVVPSGSINRQFDRPATSHGQAQPYVVRFSFDPTLVMQLRTPARLGTRIFLPDWERVQEPIWNSKPWSFEVARIAPAKLLVLGHAPGDDTMLTVVGTSGNIYTFYVRAEGGNAANAPDAIAVVEAPRPAPASGAPLALAATAALQPAAAEPLDFAYRWFVQSEADRDIAPERIFRLGPYTYFDFGTRAETMTKPAIYAVVDGVETLVNVETRGPHGQLLRVDMVDVDFALKSGERIVCVRRARGARPAPAQEETRGTLASLLQW
jgi:ComB9 competence protein